MPHLSESIMQGASASSRTIALVTDTNDWHARALGKAFAALGVADPSVEASGLRFRYRDSTWSELAGFRPRAAGRGTRARHGGRNL